MLIGSGIQLLLYFSDGQCPFPMPAKRQLPGKGYGSDGRTGASAGDVRDFSAVIKDGRAVPSLPASSLVGFSQASMNHTLS